MGERVNTDWARFGTEIRRLREQAGLSQAKLGHAVGYSQGFIGKLENGTRDPKEHHVSVLDEYFNTSGSLLLKWANIKRHLGDPEWYKKVVTSEEQATEIRMYNSVLVPGLFQTKDYARVIFTDGQPLAAENEIERMVEARHRRKTTLLRKGGPKLWALIDEYALRRVVGDERIMVVQLTELIALAESRAVKLHVIPERTPRHPGLSGPFRLLSFKGETSLAYVEHAAGGELIDDNEMVRVLTAIFGDLQGWALTPPQSVELIKGIRGSLHE